jgi:TonB-linked SusC/RagA family outer membrane protein
LSTAGAGTALPNQTTLAAKENLLSFFGRANYTLMDKYLLTVTVRADGSSKFAKGNQWGVFPSAALAWRISDEQFMQNTRNWLSSLKLRLSYGTAGNNRINSGLTYTAYSLSSNTARAPFFNGDRTSMMELGSYLYNPKLKWETTVTRNFGIDYGFWNNRLSGSIDLYWNTTNDLLMKTEIPANAGYNYQYQNFGSTSNKGVELSMNAIIADKKKFGLNFNFNISYNRNRIEKLNTDNPWQSSGWGGSTIAKYEDFRVEEGGRLGEIWGYKTNGFYTAYDPVTNPEGELILNGTNWVLKDGLKDNSVNITGGSYFPGGLKVECDENGEPIKQKLGNTVAPVYGGFGFNGRAGNFDFTLFFNFSIGNKIVNATKLATSFFAGTSYGYNLNEDFCSGKRYTWIDPTTGYNLGKSISSDALAYYGGEAGIISRLNQINANASIYNPVAVTQMQLTDYAVENASFLRVNNITIGYSLPKSWIRKCYMQNVRIYVTGYNLFCLTNYSGTDPEVDTSSKRNPMTPGIDYAAYPKSRSFVGGINVTF